MDTGMGTGGGCIHVGEWMVVCLWNAFPNWAVSVAEDEPKLQRLDVPELGDT